MVADGRQAQAITAVAPVQSWERYREDARDAVLARIVGAAPARAGAGAGAGSSSSSSANAPQPTGLVRALVVQAKSATEALVDISGRSFVVNTRQQLTPGTTVVLRLLDDRSFLQAEATGATTVRVRPGELRAAGPLPAAAPGADAAPAASDADGASAARAVRGVAPVPMPALAQLRTETGDAKVELSGSARLLLALADEAPGPQRTVPVPTLRLDPHADTATTAQRLQQAVEQSGLFYESHLQQWREGRRSLDVLKAEPQAALSPGPRAADDAAEPRPAPAAHDGAPDTPEQSATKGLEAALRAIPSDLKPLVHDQIAMLESGRLAMQGTLGEQPFTLEVEPDAGRAFDADLPMAWRVRLTVDAPNLGKLQLDVSLAGTSAQVAVRPDTRSLRGQRLRDVQDLLKSGAVDLQQALDARGLAMSDLTVSTAAPRAASRS